MIFYATKKTFERYKLKEPHEFSDEMARDFVMSLFEHQKGDPYKEWALKLFYFDRRKCIACVNFATKLTIFLVDIKVNDLTEIGNYVAHYIQYLFENDEQIQPYLEKYMTDDPLFLFAPLKNKSAIATVNHAVTDFACDGYRLYDYIEGGILNTHQLNYDANFDNLTTVAINGRKEYVYPGEYFKQLIIERYSD